MFNFWKKRREAKQQRQVDQVLSAKEADQQRKFETVMDAHEAVLMFYEAARPVTLQDELKAVAASFEQVHRGDQARATMSSHVHF